MDRLFDFNLADAVIAIFTVVIGCYTIKLFLDAKEKGRKELRAYISFDDIYFRKSQVETHILGEKNTVMSHTYPGPLTAIIKNYGKTPAYQMVTWLECSNNPPQPMQRYKFSGNTRDEEMIHPSQEIEAIFDTDQRFTVTAEGFYVFGRIIYRDIHDDWWITDICYAYEGENRFTPYQGQNGERGPFKKCPDEHAED